MKTDNLVAFHSIKHCHLQINKKNACMILIGCEQAYNALMSLMSEVSHGHGVLPIVNELSGK